MDFGRSDTRQALRRHFEVDAECIAVAALYALAKQGKIKREQVDIAIEELGINPRENRSRISRPGHDVLLTQSAIKEVSWQPNLNFPISAKV